MCLTLRFYDLKNISFSLFMNEWWLETDQSTPFVIVNTDTAYEKLMNLGK